MFTGIGTLPHFNPDLEEREPRDVLAFRTMVHHADGILISSPEYAHGVPGCLKNALDWLVGGVEFVGKPVALFNASPRATYAQDSLRETLTVMSGRFITDACLTVPLQGKTLSAPDIVAHPVLARDIRNALTSFIGAIGQDSHGGDPGRTP